MLDVTLLQPHPVADEEMQWVEANLPMACGTFRAAESTCIEKNLLLHRVICAHEQPSKLFFRVYPRKGEIWAIYNHWNIDWTISGMSTNVQYKLVEIVTDFTQEAGVTVAALVRAEEHDNVFRRQLHEGFWLFMTFKRKELLRFSHRIPSLKITGDQAGGCTSGGSFRVKFSHNGI
ncbi:uncharacterized protein A4U43_C09F14780 [Asparagus officinalis]|uniref:DUF3444 domain-containing protein n=1 Tax=Asparagus officinalis TaxID=4686 RepID=A0A5P1EAQ8_ASPOF|nr:uncharacterized protein LOC109824478 [Asparagus officinalis]ONK58605.1 uncharacterized protein A4U43_C09F14780 [Asparagus officinalis]